MKHIDERQLELLILDSAQLPSDVRSSIESHLASCSYCSRVLEEIRSFYADLPSAQKPDDAKVDEWLAKVNRKTRIIQLHPYHFVPDPGLVGEQYMTVLAAKSVDDRKARFSQVCILYSNDEDVLVRILRDNDSGIYKLYLVSSTQNKFDGALVRFPSIGIDVRTDAKGHGEFSLQNESAIEWAILTAELQLGA